MGLYEASHHVGFLTFRGINSEDCDLVEHDATLQTSCKAHHAQHRLILSRGPCCGRHQRYSPIELVARPLEAGGIGRSARRWIQRA